MTLLRSSCRIRFPAGLCGRVLGDLLGCPSCQVRLLGVPPAFFFLEALALRGALSTVVRALLAPSVPASLVGRHASEHAFALSSCKWVVVKHGVVPS